MLRYFKKHLGQEAFSRRKKKSALAARNRTSRLHFETLEHRWMLSNGPIVINELHVDPDIKTEPVEFIELYNAGPTTVDLSGWYFSNGVSYTFSNGTQLQASHYLVVSENPAAVQSKYGVSSLGPFAGKLSNEGEKVTLCDWLGTVQDEVEYGMGFPWPTVGEAGNTMELINPGLDNNLGGSWRSSQYTSETRQAIFGLNSQWRYFKGTTEPSTGWQDRGFSDGSWLTGTGAVGYSNDADEQAWIKTTITGMSGSYTSLYFRKTFDVANLSALTSLLLEARYDDGINVWINGRQRGQGQYFRGKSGLQCHGEYCDRRRRIGTLYNR